MTTILRNFCHLSLIVVAVCFGQITAAAAAASSVKTETGTGPDSGGIYTAVAPKSLRSNSQYNVSLTLEEFATTATTPTTFNLTVNCSNEIYNASEIRVLEPGESATASILIGAIPTASDYCRLTVHRCTSGLATSCAKMTQDSTKIRVNRKEIHILIQTDKPIYKPGELVRFRIILLNRFMIPITNNANDFRLNVTIFDSQNNVIRLDQNLDTAHALNNIGLYSSQILLSSEPNLGDWKIQARFSDEVVAKKFKVDQYVLPKFKVEVKLDPVFVTYNNSRVIAQVEATYTFGKPVAGNCTIRLMRPHSKHHNGYYYYRKRGPEVPDVAVVERSVTLTSNGVALVEFDIVKDLNLDEDDGDGDDKNPQSFKFQATVTEALTGKQRNGSNSIKIYEHVHKIEQINHQKIVKPGFPIIFNFKVSTQDNIPISDPRPDAVQISHGYAYDAENGHFNSTVPPNGIVALTVQAPTNELIYPGSIYVTFKDLTTAFNPPTPTHSASKTYMEISCLTPQPLLVGAPIPVLVKANKPFSSLNYVLLMSGEILDFKKFQDFLGENEKKIVISLPVPVARQTGSGSAGSEATLTVYAMFPNSENEIIAASIKLKFGPSPLDNFLNISLSENRAEPGQNVTLTLRTQPNSTIALKAVDQSVLLLKSESDISQDVIQNEIKMAENRGRSWKFWDQRGHNSALYRTFDQAGLVILTNGHPKMKQRPAERPVYGFGWGSYHHHAGGGHKHQKPGAGQKYQKAGAPKTRDSEIRVRKDFPETWIWEEISAKGDSGSTTTNLSKTVPDTLTSWVITGFSLNALSGLGISPDPPQILTSFRPFFLSLNLPYSVVKGEVFALQVLIHNYLGQNVSDAEITLFNDEKMFDFVNDEEVGLAFVTKKLDLVGDAVAMVTFLIVPTSFGILRMNVIAVTPTAGDALSQPLRVKPPGHQEIRTRAVFLDLGRPMPAPIPGSGSPTKFVNETLTAEFPEMRVPGADSVKLSVIGDLLGSTMHNLDKLIKLPLGCGEQNMLNFVPDIVILDYLQATGKLTPEIKSKALRFLESGYQRQLNYMHDDGSFSAFGKSDPSGSTWLTAFVLKSFAAAGKHITIDEKVMTRAVNFLIQNQLASGQFVEAGRVISSDIQGGLTGNGLALTAYVVQSLIEVSFNPEINPKVLPAIRSGLDFVAINSAYNKDTYALALAAYTLHLGDHEMKDWLFKRLERKARVQGQGPGGAEWKFWEKSDKPNLVHGSNMPEGEDLMGAKFEKVKPVSVEMTAYALMTYLSRKNFSESVPIVKWLLQQRTPEGGFRSTQDTIVGLTALASFAMFTTGAQNESGKQQDLSIKVVYYGTTQDIKVDSENALVLQEFLIPGASSVVEISARGNGTALAQLSWSYYVEETGAAATAGLPMFDLKVEVMKHAANPATSMMLRICNSFLTSFQSNMAVMEIDLPSGYSFDLESVASSVFKVEHVRRYELEESDTKLNVYFDYFSKTVSCLNVRANQIFQVANPANASVLVYDYYDNTRRAIAFYEPPKLSVCDICSNEISCDIKDCS